MDDVVGFTVLVCAVAVGLAHLAVSASEQEHRLARAMVTVLAVPVALVSLGTAALMLLCSSWSRHLRSRLPVPDRVPSDWVEG